MRMSQIRCFPSIQDNIVEMGVYEFDQEVYDQVLLENGAEIGIRIYQEIQAGKTDNKLIAKSSGCREEEVEMVRRRMGI